MVSEGTILISLTEWVLKGRIDQRVNMPTMECMFLNGAVHAGEYYWKQPSSIVWKGGDNVSSLNAQFCHPHLSFSWESTEGVPPPLISEQLWRWSTSCALILSVHARPSCLMTQGLSPEPKAKWKKMSFSPGTWNIFKTVSLCQKAWS